MSKEMRLKVLRHLVDSYTKTREDFYGGDSKYLAKQIGITSEDSLLTLLTLAKEKLITLHYYDQSEAEGIKLTGDGLTYFDRPKEAEIEKKSEKQWDIIQLLIGFIFGIISALLTSYLIK